MNPFAKKCLVSLFIAPMSLAAFAQPTIVNPSFEVWTGGSYSSNFPNLVGSVSMAGWTNVLGRIDVFTATGYNAASGTTALRLHPDGLITAGNPTSDFVYQFVPGFQVGGVYSLTFQMAASSVLAYRQWANIASSPGLKLTIGDAVSTHTLAAFNPSTSSFGSNPFRYQQVTQQFTATNDTMLLRLDVLNNPGAGGVALDSFQITAITAIPEPSTMAQLGLGLLLLALGACRKSFGRGRAPGAA
jgi:hypothetical protein